MSDQLTIFDQLESPAKIRFREYHEKNPHVYKMFTRLTLDAILRGHKYLGAKCIAEVMRWQTNLKTDDRYKVNNNYPSFYARMFEQDFPAHEGFFRKRSSEAD